MTIMNTSYIRYQANLRGKDFKSKHIHKHIHIKVRKAMHNYYILQVCHWSSDHDQCLQQHCFTTSAFSKKPQLVMLLVEVMRLPPILNSFHFFPVTLITGQGIQRNISEDLLQFLPHCFLTQFVFDNRDQLPQPEHQYSSAY